MTSQMISHLELTHLIPPIRLPLQPARNSPQFPIRPLEITIEDRPGHSVCKLHVGHVPPCTGSCPQRERAESPALALDLLLRVVVTHEPAFGLVGVAFGEERLVVVNRVWVYAEVDAGGDVVPVELHARAERLAPEGAGYRGGHAKGFVDAGAEVVAGVHGVAGLDFGAGAEG